MEQYQLLLDEKEKARFIAAAKKEMSLRKMSMRELAEKTGRSPSSVYQFFADTRIKNKFLAAKIAFVLDIRREDWR